MESYWCVLFVVWVILNVVVLFVWLDDVEDVEWVCWGGGGIRLGDGVGMGDVEVFEVEEDGCCGGVEGLELLKELKWCLGSFGCWGGVVIVGFLWFLGWEREKEEI